LIGQAPSSGESRPSGERIRRPFRSRAIEVWPQTLANPALLGADQHGGECLGKVRLERRTGFERSSPTAMTLERSGQHSSAQQL
jgi:hypothetical protein